VFMMKFWWAGRLPSEKLFYKLGHERLLLTSRPLIYNRSALTSLEGKKLPAN